MALESKSEIKTVYSASPESLPKYIAKVWAHRSMILVLAKRDLKIKYAQTSLGLLWTALQPLAGLLIFYFLFNQVIRLEGIPESGYAIFAFTGMASWYFFSYIVYQASFSLLQAQDLIKKIYFPKIILLISKVLVGLVDLGVSIILLFIIMLIKGIYPDWHVVFLPAFVILNAVVGLAVSVWLCALTVRNRDLQHLIPYLVNFGVWLTPVFYPGSMIPKKFESLLFLNPMAGVIEGFRWAIWEYGALDIRYLAGFGLALVMLFTGLLYFKKMEDEMTDKA